MATQSGTVTTDITIVDSVFVFTEVSNTTGDAVTVEEGERWYGVDDTGSYQLTFNAVGFDFATSPQSPIGFPDGPVSWLTLNSGATAATFTVTVSNSGTVENQTGKFLIHSSGNGDVDPTVVNNPNPPAAMRHGRQAGAGQPARQHAARA